MIVDPKLERRMAWKVVERVETLVLSLRFKTMGYSGFAEVQSLIGLQKVMFNF
jgi:hypothetical protein